MIGFIFVHSPVPGLRKSGMPDSVLIPAPVNTTARCASAIKAWNRSRSSVESVTSRASVVPMTQCGEHCIGLLVLHHVAGFRDPRELTTGDLLLEPLCV